MQRHLSLLSLLLLVLASALAFPGSNGDNAQSRAPQIRPAIEPRLSKSRSVFPQLTWLRDTAVEKIFGVPPKSKVQDKPSRQSYTSQLPATLLAKYGGDVVLRFNISTSEEEAALSEAADTLFLDVWEFADNWADIRLREDDVSLCI
jgi:extracellular matrix protein 14